MHDVTKDNKVCNAREFLFELFSREGPRVCDEISLNLARFTHKSRRALYASRVRGRSI